MIKYLFSLICISIGIATSAQFSGNQVFNSINVTGSARIAATGGTYLPVQDNDLELGIFNPSVLDTTMHNQFTMSYVNYFTNINLGYAALAKQIDSSLTVAGSVRFMSYGKFDTYDASGVSQGEFYAGDVYATFGAGKQIDTNWRVGANVKLLYSALEKYYSFGLGVDVAATYYNPEKRFTAVWILKNAGYQLKTFNDERENLPIELQFGISKKLLNAPIRFSLMGENLQKWDLTYDNPNEIQSVDPITGEPIGQTRWKFGDELMRHIVVGTEILFTDNLHFRFGYNYRRRQEMKIDSKPGTAGLSLGVGFKLKRFNISYARSTYHLAGPSNHFTISTGLPSRN